MSGSGSRFWWSLSSPLVCTAGLHLGGGWIALGPLYLLCLIPLVDALWGHDRHNPIDGRVLEPSGGRDAALWIWIPAQLSFLAFAAWRAEAFALVEWVGAAVAVGLVSGAGAITVAHELMHRPDKLSRGAAELLMSTVAYAHFCSEHVHGHHRRVATPEDPATSRLDESIYTFWPRSIVGGWRSARVHDRGWSRRHPQRLAPATRRRIVFAALVAGAWLIGSWAGVGLLYMQAGVGVLLLETINYIEHYGLVRERSDSGRYVRVQPHHSWNASHRLTNALLFNLQRHSDHHATASRPYWALRHFDEVPQLPFGYATAFLVALVPPLWKRIMNPRVHAWEARGD